MTPQQKTLILRFADFDCSVTAPDVWLSYIKKYFSGTTVAIMRGRPSALRLSITTRQRGQNTFFSFSSRGNRFEVKTDDRVYFFFPLITNIIQRIFTRAIKIRGGVVLHGAAVSAHGHAYVFLGKSGAGKTTITRLLEKESGVHILADNHVFLAPQGKDLLLFPFPFDQYHGRENTPHHLPVARVFFLKQARRHAITRLSLTQAFTMFSREAQIQVSPGETSGSHMGIIQKILLLLVSRGTINLLHFSLNPKGLHPIIFSS